jgi:hypothetical protein
MQKLLSFKRMLSLAKTKSRGLKNCSIFFWAKLHQIFALIFLILTYTNNSPWKQKKDPNQPDFEGKKF